MRHKVGKSKHSGGGTAYITPASTPKEVALEIRSLVNEALVVQAAETDKEAPARIINAVMEKWTHIDIIINNAGAGDDCLLKDLTYDLLDKIINTNLRMATFLVKEALPHLGKAPRIVNISSVMARIGGAYATAHTASKAALEGVTKVWAAEPG